MQAGEADGVMVENTHLFKAVKTFHIQRVRAGRNVEAVAIKCGSFYLSDIFHLESFHSRG